ncbi:hypothetical protein BC567DRAFT_16755 [Phyllosticta citribraziliensis]
MSSAPGCASVPEKLSGTPPVRRSTLTVQVLLLNFLVPSWPRFKRSSQTHQFTAPLSSLTLDLDPRCDNADRFNTTASWEPAMKMGRESTAPGLIECRPRYPPKWPAEMSDTITELATIRPRCRHQAGARLRAPREGAHRSRPPLPAPQRSRPLSSSSFTTLG